jgi:hypothetical protein
MPTTASQENTIKLSNGQILVLTPSDKLEQTTKVTVVCDGPRCAARNNTESPKSFTYDPQAVAGDDYKLPEESDQFISLVISVRSPSYKGVPLNMCGPQCIKDFLTYTYKSAGPREKDKFGLQQSMETVQPPASEYIANAQNGFVITPVSQADGTSDPGDEHQ